MQFSEADRKRMLWHSRRGMLELDLVLLPFAQKYLHGLGEIELGLYRQLLDQEDQDLFGWFIKREIPPTADLHRIVTLILDLHSSDHVSAS